MNAVNVMTVMNSLVECIIDPLPDCTHTHLVYILNTLYRVCWICSPDKGWLLIRLLEFRPNAHTHI